MAKIAFGMNVSLDGYVDHDRFAPDPALFRHWIDHMRGIAGCLYGRKLYEIMRYWEEDQPEWGADERAFAQAWRGQHKWVVSRTLEQVGPNATLISGDLVAAVRALKQEHSGEIELGGPALAGFLTDHGLIDEYRLYYHPVVLGQGRPFFTGQRPKMRLVSQDRIGEEVVRLTYAPQ
jgi:dihydrofolate reductase